MNDKYNKQEKELIIKTKDIVRLDPEFKTEFDLENDDDIIKGIFLYINHYHMSTPNQCIATEIFRKNGLWMNGKITLKERDQQILDEKVSASIAFKEAVLKKKNRLIEFKRVIDDKIQETEDMPIKITLDMDQKRIEIQDNAYLQLNEIESKLIDGLTQMMKTSIKEFRAKQGFILTDLKKQLDVLKKEERSKLDSILKEYDELIGMQREYAQISDKYDSEIKEIKKKIDVIDIKLFELTIRELREIAEEKGIEVPARILKADIVNLIEESE